MRTYLLISMLCLPMVASATTITFNFNEFPGNLGIVKTYTVGSYSITATAEGTPTPDLWGKAEGGSENGLGLTSDPSGDHEVTAGNVIQLNISSILGNGPLTLTMGSVTAGQEDWEVFETNKAGAFTGKVLDTGDTQAAFVIDPADTYLDITATRGNILLSTLSFSVKSKPQTPPGDPLVPEPSSAVLIGIGFGLLCMFLSFRRRHAS